MSGEVEELRDAAKETNLTALADFDISEETGFVPSPPLRRLPAEFEQWEDVVIDLRVLLPEKRIRETVDKLPPFQVDKLKSVEEWRRALLVLTSLAQGYLWVEGESGLSLKLPSVLAVPLCAVAKHLDVPPVITYASCVLYNWGLRDPAKPMKPGDNMFALVNYTGTSDESWFYMAHVVVELEAAPALKAIMDSIVAMRGNDHLRLLQNLATVQAALKAMMSAVNLVFKNCDPEVFYLNVRPYMAGTEGFDMSRSGVLFEGVDEVPRKYRGASGAQSSTVMAIDAFIGSNHRNANAAILEQMRQHMPAKHRDFILYLTRQPSLRTFINDSDHLELKRQYNSTVEALFNFRSAHYGLVKRFIQDQSERLVVRENAESLKTTGSGGTDFRVFLKQVREDANALKIPM